MFFEHTKQRSIVNIDWYTMDNSNKPSTSYQPEYFCSDEEEYGLNDKRSFEEDLFCKEKEKDYSKTLVVTIPKNQDEEVENQTKLLPKPKRKREEPKKVSKAMEAYVTRKEEKAKKLRDAGDRLKKYLEDDKERKRLQGRYNWSRLWQFVTPVDGEMFEDLRNFLVDDLVKDDVTNIQYCQCTEIYLVNVLFDREVPKWIFKGWADLAKKKINKTGMSFDETLEYFDGYFNNREINGFIYMKDTDNEYVCA